jgi:ABC-type transport system substrate-binding protein
MVEQGANRVGYKNAEVDKLIVQARQTLDAAQRATLNRRIHKLIYEDQPCAFLCTPIDLFAWNKRYHIEFYDYYPPNDLRRVTIDRGPDK